MKYTRMIIIDDQYSLDIIALFSYISLYSFMIEEAPVSPRETVHYRQTLNTVNRVLKWPHPLSPWGVRGPCHYRDGPCHYRHGCTVLRTDWPASLGVSTVESFDLSRHVANLHFVSRRGQLLDPCNKTVNTRRNGMSIAGHLDGAAVDAAAKTGPRQPQSEGADQW